ncbi:FAD-dependent oxidoreductase [Paenibacillus gansuensis]|uniref:FAD-dependent oxidoreductase n=1 Tax=Paenibacillus gansuensis TaxID=306542 RepID=A0ABW5PDE5_9BACL
MSTDPIETFPQFPQSYWLDSQEIPEFPELTSDLEVDVAIVGAGITGLTTAYLLTQKGLKVAVLNAGRILHGTTGHTTAKITAQHGLIYDEYRSHFGKEKARHYYEANQEALDFIRNTIQEHNIDCQFLEQDAYVYTQDENYIRKLEAEADAYSELGIQGRFEQSTPLPFSVKGAVVMERQAQFNPVPFLTHLVKHIVKNDGHIFENTTVNGVEKSGSPTVTTQNGRKVHCKYAVSASHFPFNDRNGFYFARLHTERSYALAAKTSKPYPGGMYINAESPARSLRSVLINGEPMVIFSGEGHKTGQGICTFRHFEALEKFGSETFGIENIPYRWSAQDVFTLDNLPYIGQELQGHPNILVATGYRKWGMTTSVVAAILNTKLITGEDSPYRELFDPHRFHADPDIKTFIAQNTDVAKHLVAGKLEFAQKHTDEIDNDEGAVVRIKGKRAGAYRDPNGVLHLVDTTCTHMGCEVEWNGAERTWDCPCHGSRYNYEGDVIEGPAKKALGKVDAP